MASHIIGSAQYKLLYKPITQIILILSMWSISEFLSKLTLVICSSQAVAISKSRDSLREAAYKSFRCREARKFLSLLATLEAMRTLLEIWCLLYLCDEGCGHHLLTLRILTKWYSEAQPHPFQFRIHNIKQMTSLKTRYGLGAVRSWEGWTEQQRWKIWSE